VSAVLVTGGAGFIGSHLVDALLDRRQRVRVLDNLDPLAHPAGGPCHLNGEAELIVGDLRDADVVAEALAGVDQVFHLGGVVGNGESMINVRRAVDSNSAGTATLLEAVLARRDRIRRLVVAS
jgi:dTDP-L-rhamnose 4-epimerase